MARLPHFRNIAPEVRDRVARRCRAVELASGDDVFREGEQAEAFFAVVEGVVKVFKLTPDGREQVVHHISPGRTFAEAALFHHGVYPASARAEATPTTLIRIDGGVFAEEPSLAPAMVGSLCAWLHTLLDRIEELMIVSAGARLAHYMLRLPAKDTDAGLEVTLPVAKKTLAAELSITPETLSRLLARWKTSGLVDVAGRRVVLKDAGALENIAAS